MYNIIPSTSYSFSGELTAYILLNTAENNVFTLDRSFDKLKVVFNVYF